MMQQQMDIPGYGGRYYITMEGYVFHRWKTKDTEVQRINRKNGVEVRLTDLFGQRHSHRVASLMKQTYFKGYKGPLRHKNGCKSDCSRWNLQPVSPTSLGKLTGHQSKARTVCKMDSSGQVVSFYRSARQAAKENYMSYQTVIDRCNGKVKSPYAPDGYRYEWEK